MFCFLIIFLEGVEGGGLVVVFFLSWGLLFCCFFFFCLIYCKFFIWLLFLCFWCVSFFLCFFVFFFGSFQGCLFGCFLKGLPFQLYILIFSWMRKTKHQDRPHDPPASPDPSCPCQKGKPCHFPA